MNPFNQNSRTQNSLITAAISELSTVINLILGFVYRSIFLTILSAEYLGINGLFTNILQILSLADLGISSAIVFRFYKPIQEGNVEQVGKLMNFFKTVYRIIFITIVGLGLCVLPLLPYLIEDTSEVPSDINLYFIYFLFLMQTASSYMFAYRQTILTADQRQYTLSLFRIISTVVRYALQLAILITTHDYTVTLLISIIVNVLSNYLISLYAKFKYKEVFKVKGRLSKEERQEILHDTRACMCHKVGSVVLNSTDNLVLSKFAGLFSVGVYSNYSMIISNLSSLASQLLGNTTASLGNAHVSLDNEERYRIYKNLNFTNLWVASSLTVCLYVLITPFIHLWVGDDLGLGKVTVIALCMQFYLEQIRCINYSFTSASGLFVKDVWRPFLEAGINLVISIVLVILIGVPGVFIGTVVSSLCTVTWREPYILFKYDFQKPLREYWRDFFAFALIIVLLSAIFDSLLVRYISGILSWVGIALVIFALTEVFLIIVFRKRTEFEYLKDLTFKLIRKFLSRFAKHHAGGTQ